MGKLSKNEIDDYKINNLIRLVIYVVFVLTGIILYAKSYLRFNVITNYLGVLFIVTGCVCVYMSSKEKKLSLSNYDVIFAILSALSGLLLIINPGNMTNNLTFYFGLFIIFGGLQKLVVALKLSKKKDDAAILVLVSSLLIVSLGIVLMLNVFKNTSLTEICGMFSLFYGIVQLSTTILLNNKEKDIIKKN